MTILITGTSRGIGLALAIQYLSEGHEVWGVSRTAAPMTFIKDSVGKSSQNYCHLFCDLSKESEVNELAHTLKIKDITPDIIYFNASIEIEQQEITINSVDMKNMIVTNFTSALLLVGVFIPIFLKKGSGKFVMISTLFDNWADVNSPIYSATKSGLSMAFRGYYLRYHTQNIQFQVLSLGPINTFINPRFQNEDISIKKLWVADPEDVAVYAYNRRNTASNRMFYPFYVRLLYVFLSWMPDWLFDSITTRFKR